MQAAALFDFQISQTIIQHSGHMQVRPNICKTVKTRLEMGLMLLLANNTHKTFYTFQ